MIFTETIYTPGWYRITMSQSQDKLDYTPSAFFGFTNEIRIPNAPSYVASDDSGDPLSFKVVFGWSPLGIQSSQLQVQPSVIYPHDWDTLSFLVYCKLCGVSRGGLGVVPNECSIAKQRANNPVSVTSAAALKALNESLQSTSQRFMKYVEDSLKECPHEYIPYTGLVEQFEYCKHCDQKKA